jgi:fatty-acyl-CoA synthase
VANEKVKVEADFTFAAQLEARAQHAELEGKDLLLHGDRRWTYRQYRDQSVRMAHFLLRRLGRIDDERPGHVAMLLENHLELLALYGGCAYAGLTLFGINTGLRGEVLAGVINQSRARVLVVDEKLYPEIERVAAELRTVAAENILILPTQRGDVSRAVDLRACLESEVGPESKSLDAPDAVVTMETNLMVIYTSGTTGLPKGINNNNMKLCFIGAAVSDGLDIGRDDVGYACMPLFHSNAIFVGFMPAFWAGGSMALRERFSASQFVPDVLRYGVTMWNYVGEPVHYVLAAIESKYGGDEERILREVAQNPRNRMRFAVGNGAAPPDIDRFSRWLGLEDMYELYGSTEAAISTFRRKGDPRGCVGQITDPAVQILDENGNECPPAELGPAGELRNYEKCVGEICRVAADAALFQGYFDNPQASSQKYRDGVYHSGDLGHVLVRDGARFLYFDGRTDDWIRKDGENFSAGQVGRMLSEHPDVSLAVAYGVPCSVSDELVMTAMKLREGARFDSEGFFAWCTQQVEGGSMDKKWFPDFVRLVDDFEYTETQKVLVRNLKKCHFDRRRLATEPIYWRRRGDEQFVPFTDADFASLREEFARAERAELLDR